jgi:hypothetical protein
LHYIKETCTLHTLEYRRTGVAREKERLNLMFDKGQVAKLRALAAQYGFIATTGSQAGQGSIAQLMDAIAERRYLVLPSATEKARVLVKVSAFMDSVATTTAAIHSAGIVTSETWDSKMVRKEEKHAGE